MINSFQDLNTRFAQVASQPHAVTRKSAGAVGELFEQLMVGGVVGNDRGADFAAINTEAKVHHGKGVMTVFTFAPTTGMSATEFKDAHGSTVVRRGVANGKGGSVEVNGSMVNVTVGVSQSRAGRLRNSPPVSKKRCQTLQWLPPPKRQRRNLRPLGCLPQGHRFPLC